MVEETLSRMDVGAGEAARGIAVRARAGKSPGILWLGGFKSDMRGTKAEALAAHAAKTGQAYVRFDYSGHGESGGSFEAGTISRWLEEARAVLERTGALTGARGPQVVVGSSMGGWIALLLARALAGNGKGDAAKLAGLVLIAPAPDFTEALMWAQMSPEVRREIEEKGCWLRPSEYGDGPYPITRALIEDGRRHLLLDRPIEIGCPVRILQGVLDPDVPWRHALKLVSCLAQDDVVLTLVKDGDHRLSRPEDIERLLGVVDELSGEI
jgi:pimeloyl-ACP methyl ester carboxylesterase